MDLHVLAFGDSTAPWVFTYLLYTMEELATRELLAIYRYIDDFASRLLKVRMRLSNAFKFWFDVL